MKKNLLLVLFLTFFAAFAFFACSSGSDSGRSRFVAVKYIDFAAEDYILPAGWEAGEPDADGTPVIYLIPNIEYTFKAGVFVNNENGVEDISGEYSGDSFNWDAVLAYRTAIMSLRTGKSIELKTGEGGYGTITVTVSDIGIFTFKVKDIASK